MRSGIGSRWYEWNPCEQPCSTQAISRYFQGEAERASKLRERDFGGVEEEKRNNRDRGMRSEILAVICRRG